MYLWEQADWPELRWDPARVLGPLAEARLKQGRLLGQMERLGFDLKLEAQVSALTEDVVRSSEIEGEMLDRAGVRSSIARRFGLPDGGVIADRRTEGVVDMTLDATLRAGVPLTRERLLGWQAALFPTGFSGARRVRVGALRDDADGPMQVVSGPIGRVNVHFEAPPADGLEGQLDRFLTWFACADSTDGLVRAGLAHLWFVTLHPFEDGNGRVARAIADCALAQADHAPQRFYSMSSQLRVERSDYYAMLERTQQGGVDVTDWLVWFLGCFSRAVDAAAQTCAGVLRKADFWQRHAADVRTDRARRVLNRYLDGFDGHLTAKKWAAIGGCSVPTAQRDFHALVVAGVLAQNPGGSKNSSYRLALDSSVPLDAP